MRMKSVTEVLKNALTRIDVKNKSSLPEYRKYVEEMRTLFDDPLMLSGSNNSD